MLPNVLFSQIFKYWHTGIHICSINSWPCQHHGLTLEKAIWYPALLSSQAKNSGLHIGKRRKKQNKFDLILFWCTCKETWLYLLAGLIFIIFILYIQLYLKYNWCLREICGMCLSCQHQVQYLTTTTRMCHGLQPSQATRFIWTTMPKTNKLYYCHCNHLADH